MGDYKGDVMFVLVTTDEAEHKRVIDFFGIKEEELPTMRITASEEDMVKFKPEDASLTEANMRAVLKKFKAGEMTPHLKSEEQPADWDANPVKVLVSSNFASLAWPLQEAGSHLGRVGRALQGRRHRRHRQDRYDRQRARDCLGAWLPHNQVVQGGQHRRRLLRRKDTGRLHQVFAAI